MALSLQVLLHQMVQMGGTDLHITTQSPPIVRVHGKLNRLDYPPLTPAETKQLIYAICTDAQKHRFEEDLELDFSFGIKNVARFRANVFFQRGAVAGAFRLIPYEIRGFKELGLPPVFQKICDKPRGLVLVTGPTGSGKSTTLAAMIDKINQDRYEHILTIEDPVEYLHKHKNCMVNQRELHADTHSFHNALRSVLREDPDVVLIGEMRDLETIEAALTAAETGHLVFGTLHTTGSVRTIDRVVDAFPTNQQEQIRTQLAGNLKAVISQTLIPRKSGFGRVAAYEIMYCTPAIQNLIRENKSYRITSSIQTGHKYGMNLLDEHLLALYRKGICKYEDVRAKAQQPDEFETNARAMGLEGGPPPPAGGEAA